MKIKTLLRLLLAIASTAFAQDTLAQKGSPSKQVDKAQLREQLTTGDMTKKARAADALWEKSPEDRKTVEAAMESEKDPETRRRIAQVLAAKHRHPRAISLLRQSLRDSDTKTQTGAFAFMMSAMALKQSTNETLGVDEALNLVKKPGKFSDVPDGPLAYAKRDGVRTMAASYLIQNLGPGDRERLRDAMAAYIADTEGNIKSSTGQERKHWEARLATLLEMSLRAGLPSLIAGFENKKDLVGDSYNRARVERSVEKGRTIK